MNAESQFVVDTMTQLLGPPIAIGWVDANDTLERRDRVWERVIILGREVDLIAKVYNEMYPDVVCADKQARDLAANLLGLDRAGEDGACLFNDIGGKDYISCERFRECMELLLKS